MTQPPPNSNVRDVGTSIIRTVVPGAWAALLTWIATQLPALSPILNEPGMVGLGAAITGTILVLWYSLFRWLEPKLPAWLTVLVLGSNKTPIYNPANLKPSGFLRMPRDDGTYRPGSSADLL